MKTNDQRNQISKNEAVIERTGRKLMALVEPSGEVVASTRRVPVTAGSCPSCRLQGSIYKTRGRQRYCKCNNCGHFWEFDGPLSDAVHDVALLLRENLKKFDIVKVNQQEVVLWDVSDAANVVKQLEELLP